MARITSFEKLEKERQGIHSVVRCTYCISTSADGQRLFQLDTYGSRGRQMPDKVSQSIQLDKDAAARLVDLLGDAFPGLR